MKFFMNKTKKRAFTLVEMLIVIVIIGILAAALIPRLSSARGRANDTARKADLQQIASALVAYQIDNWTFPSTAPTTPSLSVISTGLISAWLSSIPHDPNTIRTFSGLGLPVGTLTAAWQYGYTTIYKWWIAANGFVLMAGAETAWWANRVVTTANSISTISTFEGITPCTSISESTTGETNSAGNCRYKKGNDVLRYIYVY